MQAWRAAGVEPDGARVWVFGGGWTPFPLLANLLVTGRLGVIDALIATTGAAYDIPVFTRDADFEGLAGVQVVRV